MFYRKNKWLSVSFVVCFLLTSGSAAFAQRRDLLNQKITINLPADSLISVLQEIDRKTEAGFVYDPDRLRSKRTASLKFYQTPLRHILTMLLAGSKLKFSLIGNEIVIGPESPDIHTIHGYVRDVSSGEELIGATVQIPELSVGVVTNQYGFYSISVPEGNYELYITYPGYQRQARMVDLAGSIQQEIELSLQPHHLQEVVIRPTRLTPNPILMNEYNLTSSQLYNAPYYAGETDVMKRLQMHSSIKTITEGSSALFVRGGNSDQNLILLDEAIVYNPSHLFGLVSVFNADVVNNVQVYRDYMPANFGGRLSSVIVNRMAEGNNKEFHLSGGLNQMSARLAAEGPIVKDKASFMVAYRRSLLDIIPNRFKLFNPNSVYHDVNAKTNVKLNRDNSLYYSFYVGQDKLLSENSYTNNWGNFTSTLRWNHIISSKLFLNISAIYSNYSNGLDLNADTLSEKSQWDTKILDATLKADYTYYRSPNNQIKFGASTTYHRFSPGEMHRQRNFEFNISRERSIESALYFSQQIGIGKSFELNYGLRLGAFRNAQERRNIFDAKGNPVFDEDLKTFINPEPRVNFSYLPSTSQRIFVTYNRNFQYLQLVQNSVLAFSSLEPWIPASDLVKPQRSDHYAVGYRYAPGQYSFSLGGYHKLQLNQLELLGHAQIIRNPDIRGQLRSGTAKAYGIEGEVSKAEGRFSGTLSYTYSKVKRRISGINSGDTFVSNYDIPHEFKMLGKYDVNAALSVQAFFVYTAGRPLTLPVGYYQHDGVNVPLFEGRNESRFPNFNRLDVSGQYRLQSGGLKGRRLLHTISAGIYNVYNRKNPLYYHLGSPDAGGRRNRYEYGFGIYPWLAYSFKL
ncbi:TonB-dependent receptor domain-containing protein [Pedobacter deserti]|uniref:TonB-dependent receptor domain-containing protein n=1 Tax=Pedobacter deserti TaxID=2817382 RepID=UPI00210BEF54|nr:TonB-dependent receptor [Pedobacter sp. SYSU D00382]